MKKTTVKTSRGIVTELKNKYKHLVTWCEIMGSFDYYTEQQVRLASKLNAPENTIFFQDGKPVTADEITSPTTREFFKSRGLSLEPLPKVDSEIPAVRVKMIMDIVEKVKSLYTTPGIPFTYDHSYVRGYCHGVEDANNFERNSLSKPVTQHLNQINKLKN